MKENRGSKKYKKKIILILIEFLFLFLFFAYFGGKGGGVERIGLFCTCSILTIIVLFSA